MKEGVVWKRKILIGKPLGFGYVKTDKRYVSNFKDGVSGIMAVSQRMI